MFALIFVFSAQGSLTGHLATVLLQFMNLCPAGACLLVDMNFMVIWTQGNLWMKQREPVCTYFMSSHKQTQNES